MKQQRGYTVPELLIAILLFVSLGVATLGTMHGLTGILERRTQTQSGNGPLDQMLVQMHDDAHTAFAVFIPQNDVFGQQNISNLGSVPAHEVDYYSKTDTGQETWWAYRYDAVQKTLERYDYDPSTKPTTYGVFDRATGAIDTNAGYPAVNGVQSFAAATVQANQLTDPNTNRYANLISGLTQGNAPRGEPLGFIPKDGPRTDLFGGNATVQVSLTTDHGTRSIELMSGAMASGFTIPKSLEIRALLYRKDTHHQSWGGIGTKTRAHVFVQLQYHLITDKSTPKWKLWCDWQIYGGKKGVDLSDPTRDYRAMDPQELASYAFYTVTHGLASDSIPGDVPCNPQYPTASTTPPPTARIDPPATPPPCWLTADPCWPYGAPPDWTPPSPWPSSTPPAAWCKTHAKSKLC